MSEVEGNATNDPICCGEFMMFCPEEPQTYDEPGQPAEWYCEECGNTILA